MRFPAVILMFRPCVIQAQTYTQALPLNWQNGATNVAGMDANGNVTTPGSVTTGYGTAPSGQIQFFGGTSPGGSLTIQAPPSFYSGTSALNQTWLLPAGAIPSISLLQLLSGVPATLNYATLTGGGGKHHPIGGINLDLAQRNA